MGITVSGGLLYGFRVEREDFFKPVGERVVCPTNNNHDVMKGEFPVKYCPECGTRTQLKTFEEPTPPFAEFIKMQNERDGCDDSPEDFWLNWTDGCTKAGEVGVFDATAMQGGGGYGDECYILGVRLEELDYHGNVGGTQPVTLDRIEKAAILIKPMAQQLGLKLKELKLYPYIYVS